MRLLTDHARVVVPATSANLGPGYDAFGLALGLHDEVEERDGERTERQDGAGGGGDLEGCSACDHGRPDPGAGRIGQVQG